MKDDVALTATSLLTILLMTFHLSDDIVRGFEPGGFKTVNGILILAVYLFATLALGGKRSGYVLILLGSLLGFVVSLAHMSGAGLVGGRIVGSDGIHFWVWTILALGVTSVVSVLLSVRGLWRRRALPVILRNEMRLAAASED